jgi:hypothetical protein
MTKRFDLYGNPEASLEAAARQVGEALGVTFELHDSYYLGGDYYLWRGEGSQELSIQENFEDEEGYLAEGDHPSFKTLLYASILDTRAYESLGELAGWTLLRTRTI